MTETRLILRADGCGMDDIFEPPTRKELVWTLALMALVLAASQAIMLLL